MRVLTFTSLFPNAVDPLLGIFIYQRAAHLARRPGNEVLVVAPIPYFPSWLPRSRWHKMAQVPRNEQFGELTVYHPRYLLLPKISMPLHGLLMFLGSVALVRRLRKANAFDCIDAHYIYPDGFAAILLGKLLSLPVILSARGTDINLFPSFQLIRPMIRWTLRQATGVIAVCTALKDAMAEIGLPHQKMQVIGNGIDPDRFQAIDRGEARRHLNLPEDGQFIVSVGALIPRKGFQHLIPAVARIAPSFPKLRLYLVGEGAMRKELEALVRSTGMQEHIYLVGSTPNQELNFWYSAADVSCLASSREGWPNVVLESMACGTPLVATRVWGVSEIITSPDLGIMVEEDSLALAAGLEAALKKTWNRAVLAQHARKRTWEVVAAEVERYLASQIQVQEKNTTQSFH